MTVNDHDFKHCMGSFASGVTVVTTLEDNRPIGVTISAFASLSLHPPMVLFCLDNASSSFQHFHKARYFAINILSAGQEELSRVFAMHGDEKWDGVAFFRGDTGCPLLPGTLAHIECEKAAEYQGGDHVIFLGRVKNLALGEAEGKPLLYHRGHYLHSERKPL